MTCITLCWNGTTVVTVASINIEETHHFYVTVIRTVLEYACPVWHSSLTATQTKELESLQSC